MSFTKPGTKFLKRVCVAGGVLMTAVGFFCLSDIPGRIILKYLSQDEILNPETVSALMLAGTFFAIFGYGLTAIAVLWPQLLERAAALPRNELLYLASLFGTNITVFFGLALGIRSLAAYDKILVIVVVGALLFLIERRLSNRIRAVYNVIFSRRIAFLGYALAGTFFFALRFPFSTWNRYLFSRDYPMFQYTALLDLKVASQGALYGWEPAFSCGYPTFLNLRSILIPYLPFAWLPPALAFHLMLFATYISVPYLVYLLAREIGKDRDMAVLSGWAAVGAMTGYMWHILHWGMVPTFESIPFLLLVSIFFVRALNDSRWGLLLSALFWAAVAFIHFGHFGHVGLVLFLITLVYTWEDKSFRPVLALVKTSLFTIAFAAPYLALFFRYRKHIILTNMFSYPDETLMGMVRTLLNTVARFIPTLIWDWRGMFSARAFPDYGYFALATVFFLVVVYLLFSGNRAKQSVALLYAGAILVAALSFVPRFQLSFQRMLYMIPPLMALALGFWTGQARKRGHVTPFYVLVVLLIFYTRPFWMEDKAIPTLPDRAAFDPGVVEEIKALSGNYILYEDTASLTPYADVLREFPKVREEYDVHSEGFVRLETGKRFFCHPGYNPHPYYDLRWTYIATGTYMGIDLSEYPHEVFERLFKKWGVQYLVLWTRPARAYFGDYGRYQEMMKGEQYAVYRFKDADPRSVATEGGTADVSYPDHFTAVVTLHDVPPGSPCVLRANYFPDWRAACNGAAVPLRNADGQIAFDAPAADATVTLRFPRRRGWYLVPPAAFLLGLALLKRRLL